MIRKEKHDFYPKQKSVTVTNNKIPRDFKHAWLAETCLILGDLILTGIYEKRVPKNNQEVKVRDFRGATIDGLKHHLLPLLKKKP